MTKELTNLNDIIFEALDVKPSDICPEEETSDYCGCNFRLGSLNIKYRKAKITPKKIGQFVAVWKRNDVGETAPFAVEDDFDFYFIAVQHGHELGCFIFPRTILADKNILSVNGEGGKRGFRVYTKWDLPENKQAKQTHSWQILCFIDLANDKGLFARKLREMVGL